MIKSKILILDLKHGKKVLYDNMKYTYLISARVEVYMPTPSSSQEDTILKPSNAIPKMSSSASSLDTSSVSPPSSPTPLSMFQSLLGMGRNRTRTVSESQVSNVSVDLSPWLMDGDNARDLKVKHKMANYLRVSA